VRLIGKEANNIDEPQAGRYAQLGEIVAEYHNPTDDHFHLHVMPLFDYLSGRELARLVGTDRRTIDRIRAGRTPRRELRQALTQLAEGLRRDYLAGQRPGVQGPAPVERGRGTRLGSRESR
jgi:transcriptional regulator with XRE-family HTH domain